MELGREVQLDKQLVSISFKWPFYSAVLKSIVRRVHE